VAALIRHPTVAARRRWPPRHIGLFVRLFPGLFAGVYLTGTVLLFAYGPWPWPVKDGTSLYAFLAGAHASLLLGYLSAVRDAPRPYNAGVLPSRLFPLSLALNLLLVLPTVAARTGSFVPDIAAGLTNPGAAYNLSIDTRRGGSPLLVVEYIRILLAPLLALAVPLTIYYWRALRVWTRALGTLTVVGVLATFVAMGTNKAIADIILIAPWLIFASHIAGFRQLRTRQFTAVVGLLIAAVLFFFWFFTSGQLTRKGSGAPQGYFAATNMYANQQHPLVRWLPEQPRAGALALILYVSHGYYGLHLAMQEPFVPMFGAGNSMFLQRTVSRLTGSSTFATMPYPMRAEHRGWNAMGLWSTIYPWLASDLTFPGVLLIIFLIGRLHAQSWLDTLRGGNPFAIASFSMLTLMVFYFPANNQLLQDGEPLLGFLLIITVWQISRMRRRVVFHA
jgi:hypothetical protein